MTMKILRTILLMKMISQHIQYCTVDHEMPLEPGVYVHQNLVDDLLDEDLVHIDNREAKEEDKREEVYLQGNHANEGLTSPSGITCLEIVGRVPQLTCLAKGPASVLACILKR